MGELGSCDLQVECNQRAQDCLLPMGVTSENVAERYGIDRKEQDEAAVSFWDQKALPHRLGLFEFCCLPVSR